MGLVPASWNSGRQFNTALFKKLKEQVGADLQNIVYYRGDESVEA